MRRFLPATLWLVLVCAVHHAQAADPLAETLRPLIAAHDGEVAVMVKHLESGERFAHRAREPMPTASLIKLAVMIEAYRQAEAGTVKLDDSLTLTAEDKVPGSGILTPHFSAGMQLPLRDAIRLMIAYSDNTATNLVLDRIGLSSTNELMKRLDCPNTRIHAKVFRRDTSIDPERSERFGLGSTTAAEMLSLLERLHRKELVSETASAAMLEHLLACEDTVKFPRFLPEGTKVAHKTGSTNRVRCDAGIIETPAGPVAVCVLTAKNADRSWTDDNAGNRLCAEIARRVFRHFNPSDTEEPLETGLLQLGSSGELVEALQRTLNARMQPSPELSIDGEFGPATEAVVRQFQESQKLEPTGRTGPETWAALGALLTKDPPVPSPEEINAESLPKEPADVLDGPPLVTCRAWAVADGKTGEVLWGSNESDPLHIASTTKIMAAYLVLQLAQESPAVLDETVTFSRRADGTGGSTSAVRAGEQLTVRELLYG
ncbi:MAG: serine hydrolase, partial [Planctomycetaceae bacterium]